VPLAITTYNWLKTFHVLGAVLWVGGGVMLTILTLRAQRANDPIQLGKLALQIEWIGARVLGPLSLLTFGLGIGLVEEGTFAWSYDQFWIIFALAAFGVSFVTGAFFLGPESGRLARMQRERGPEDPELQARIRRVLRVARVDQLILLLIVFDMVAKPFL
jgi:uncharacterized membrane protein